MAIRKREGRKSPWQVYWNNPFTGKRETANFMDEKEAKKYDSLVKHRLKFDRESFREPEKEDSVVTLEMAYISYLREKQCSREYLEYHMYAMRPVLEKFGDTPVSEMDREMVEQVLALYKGNTKRNTTLRHKVCVFRMVLLWCARNGLCSPIPFSLPKADYEKFVPPTPDELATMLHAAPPHIQRVILMGSQCGVRVGDCELFQLTWDDVDFERRVLRVHGSKKNKSAPWREVPLRQGMMAIMREWRARDMAEGVAFIIHYRGKPVTKIKSAWKHMLKAAGISRRIRPYDLRHAFATELIAAGTDIGTVAKLMGHSSPAMILNHYQYVMDRQKRAAVENLPEIPYVPKSMCPKEKGQRLHDVTP